MEPDPSIIDALNDPEFRSYFLNLLASAATDAEKYAQMLDFFRARGGGQACSSAPLAHVAAGGEQEGGIPAEWDVSRILAQTAESIRRAVRRVERSHHRDGGWGPRVEESNLWHTAHTVLFLGAVRRCAEITVDADLKALLQAGYAYLEQHPQDWASDMIGAEGALSVYHLGMMARCFLRGGREFLRKETAVRIYRGIERLYHAQNDDGGWDASLWGYAVATPVRRFSEVGATVMAMQTLAEVGDDRFLTAMQRAAHWLACTQNLDGSWNNGSTRPDLEAYTLTGDPRAGKTCDALQGFLALRAFDLPLEPYRAALGRAVDWLRRSLTPVLTRPERLSGWGWAYTPADYENVCLALEALLRLPGVPLALSAACADWLVQTQRRQEGDVEDGSWVLGHTARIAAALTAFYQRVQEAARSTETYHNFLP